MDVSDFDQLKDAISLKRATINLKKDIELTEELAIPSNASNLSINGEGHKIISQTISAPNTSNVTKSKLTIKGTKIELKDIKFEGYTNQAISVYNAQNVTLDKIELLGTEGQSSTGIDIGGNNGGSSVILSNITSKNHKVCGIRVKDGSSVEFKGGNIHIKDKEDLQVILKDGLTSNGQASDGIKDEKQQYVDRKTSDNKNIYYTSYNKIDVSSFEQLKEAITSKRAIINLKQNIDLKEDLTIESKVSDITINGAKVPNITINGDGKSIISQTIPNNDPSKVTKSKLTIRGKNIELNGIKFEDYTNQAISVYNAEDVTLKNIELLGTEGQSSAGIDIGGTHNGSSVTLSNITSKNHKLCGIRIKQGSTVEFKGGNTHINDKQDIEVIDEENKKMC